MDKSGVVEQVNVLGEPLQACSYAPLTGFFRTGCCDASSADPGLHVICVKVTESFLAFSKQRGNDLTTARPEYRFRGLAPGDRWCLCAARWLEACEAGVAPRVILGATHRAALQVVNLDLLRRHALDD